MTTPSSPGSGAGPSRPEEQVLESWLANRTQGWRAVGGRLDLTSDRLVFRPHALDAATGGHAWECDLREITGLERSRRTWHPFNGGLRRRLRVETMSAPPEYFVVTSVLRVAARIRQELPR